MNKIKPLKNCMIYGDLDDEGFYHYIRICGQETEQFPHGLALATKCRSKEEVESFAILVDEYLELSFTENTFIYSQPEQEPVAWLYDWLDWGQFPGRLNLITRLKAVVEQPEASNVRPLYTSPPKREPLSDDAIHEIFLNNQWKSFLQLARTLEKAHGIGVENNGN
jgi:hypothetical protein